MNESSALWTHFLPAIVKSDLVNDFPQKAPREKGRNWFGWTADLWQNVHLCNFTNTRARKCVWGVVCPVKPSVTHNTVPVVCVFLCQGCGLPEMLTECSLHPPPPPVSVWVSEIAILVGTLRKILWFFNFWPIVCSTFTELKLLWHICSHFKLISLCHFV